MYESVFDKESPLLSMLRCIVMLPAVCRCGNVMMKPKNVQQKAEKPVLETGIGNIGHIAWKSKPNVFISWERRKRVPISTANAIICARSSNIRKAWKLPKRKPRNIWESSLKMNEHRRSADTL